MIREKLSEKLFGIRKQVIAVTTVVCGVIFVLTFMGVNYIVKQNVQVFLEEQYSNMNDKTEAEFSRIYEELDKLTADFVTNGYVQKTLKNLPERLGLSDVEMMKKTLSYYNKSFLDSYLILDNKGNYYSLKDVKIDMKNFQSSEICEALGEEYSRTKLIWTKDTVFGTGKMSFFTVRYIREMNFPHEPGILVLKLNDNITESLRALLDNNEIAYFIEDPEGDICFRQVPQTEKDDWYEQYLSAEKKKNNRLKDGIVSKKTNEETGFQIITFAPGKVTNRTARKIQVIMILLFMAGYVSMLGLLLFFAQRLTKPIQRISSVMRGFDDRKLDQKIYFRTNNELEDIVQAYNVMLGEVKELMEVVRHKEQELKESELQTMMYQIRPHFLYNTLDTVYMLARIQKEDTIMNMIQSLSKFLRVNLSNGNEYIEVEKELEHVSAYLNIQKIRNDDLFEYEIEAESGTEHINIMKMILQPVAENCIKYGFRDIYSGGMIRIRVYREEKYLCFSVENNGTPIDEVQMDLLNEMEKVSMDEVEQLIKNKNGGFGICNVIKRLRMKYDDRIRFYYIRKDDGTECVIKIEEECLK